ncbi:MAG: DedA family protein [Bacilli bacterium]
MEQFIISFMNQFGYIGIALLIAIENIFPPIPSEVILTFGGFMTLSTNLNVVGVIIASTVGAIVGALVLYLVGRFFNKERLEKIITGRVGKILRLKAEDINKADKWFDKHGKGTVFFCRFIPIVRSLISIPAGMNAMPIISFLLLTTGGTLIWNTVLVMLGKLAGDSWPKVVSIFGAYSKIGLLILVVLAIVLIGLFYYFRLRKKNKSIN